MKSFANFALFALLAIIGGSLATRRIIGPRGPLKLCVTAACRGDLVKADTNAESFGDLTDSFGNSNVESDLYGTRGSVSHGARGAGRFGTAARSNGQITSGNGYGDSSVGSEAAAEAFGTHNSISETRGDAESYNGMGHSGASSRAAGSGFGHSRARTSAGAGQGFRYKRTLDLEAGTDAKARGPEILEDSEPVSRFGASGSATNAVETLEQLGKSEEQYEKKYGIIPYSFKNSFLTKDYLHVDDFLERISEKNEEMGEELEREEREREREERERERESEREREREREYARGPFQGR